MEQIRPLARPLPWTDRRSVTAQPAAPATLGTVPKAIPDRVTLSGTAAPRDRDAASVLDAALDGRRPTPSDIGTCLALGRVDVAVEVAARLTGCPTAQAVQAYRDGDPADAMAQLASVGVDPATAGWLLRGLGNVPPTVRQAASAAYAATPRAPPPAADDDEPSDTVDLRI